MKGLILLVIAGLAWAGLIFEVIVNRVYRNVFRRHCKRVVVGVFVYFWRDEWSARDIGRHTFMVCVNAPPLLLLLLSNLPPNYYVKTPS